MMSRVADVNGGDVQSVQQMPLFVRPEIVATSGL